MILSIETSTSNLSLTLLINNRVINKVSIQIKNDLSEIIILTIKKFIKDNSITLLNISLLVVGCGPGSFTGIRAVISAAKGIYLSNKHMKVIGINSLAGLAMSALIEAKNINVQYIIASIDTKRDDLFLQLFRVNSNEKLLPFYAINSVQPIKIENFNDYIVENKLTNMKFSKELIQIPDALWVGKLGSCIVNNNINYKNSKIAYDELKPIYVRSAEIN